MTTDRFNQLLNGPLNHPLIPFQITRLQLALLYVLEATGPAGDRALEDYCARRQQQDEQIDEEIGDEDADAS